MGRSTYTVGTINFTHPYNFIAGKGVNMHEVCNGTRSGKVKQIYIILQEIIMLIDSDYEQMYQQKPDYRNPPYAIILSSLRQKKKGPHKAPLQSHEPNTQMHLRWK